MRFYDIIEKKKRKEEISAEEITEAIRLYVSEEIPDYQMSAFLMAVYFQGMTDNECAAMTDAVYRSGDTIDLSIFGNLTADKHSSGGVGDKTTLIVAPLAACLGCTVAKMSGRGLGHTGGTVDKLESFPGYKTTLSMSEFLAQAKDIGIAVIGQSKNLTPADKKLYALRDVTATVDSIPLICASIMGKKLASGAKNIILDVKCGSGAFMKNERDAVELAEKMVSIGTLCKRNTIAYVTDMDFPLGRAVGNICEVKEAIEILRGKGDRRLSLLCIKLAAAMAAAALGRDITALETEARECLQNGAALSKFKEWIAAQGGDVEYIDNPEHFPEPKYKKCIHATRAGYISGCNAEAIGLAACTLGAGRRTKDDSLDMTAGITLLVERGSYVAVGDILAEMYSSAVSDFHHAEELIIGAYDISDTKPEDVPIILAGI